MHGALLTGQAAAVAILKTLGSARQMLPATSSTAC